MNIVAADVGRTDPTKELNERLTRQIAENIGPVKSTLPTPAEALTYKIKLPWDWKVSHAKPKELTLALFNSLIEYGLTRTQIAHLFKFPLAAFYAQLKAWNVPPGKRGGANRAAASGNLEVILPKKEAIRTKPAPEAKPEELKLPEPDPEPEPEDLPETLLDLSGWEEIGPHVKTGGTLFVSVNRGKAYISAAAAKLLLIKDSVTILIRPDGRSIALKAGGTISARPDKGEALRVQCRQIENKLIEKKQAIPARFQLHQEGDWLIGDLES